MRFSDVMDIVDRSTALDPVAAAARTAVEKVLRNPRVRDALHGVWLGHPVHPALAQVALGSFVSASVIDLVGGHESESSRLVAVGLAATPATVVAGWADYAVAHEEQQRVGVVHAALNAAGITAYTVLLTLRRTGRRGRVLSVMAGATMGAAAALGGHLAYRQALGANHAEDVPHVGPGEWQRLGTVAGLPEDRPVRRRAGEVPVMVLRRGTTVHVLSDTCPHLSAPMHEGDLSGDTLVCSWHGSAFNVADGAVVHGPATAPLPCFETRVVDGQLEAKVREIPGVPAS